MKAFLSCSQQMVTMIFQMAQPFLAFQVAFLHLSTIDRQAPSHQQLCKGVAWILDKEQSGKGTVYVHCKAGRARSATLVAAYLIEVVNSLIYLWEASPIQRK